MTDLPPSANTGANLDNDLDLDAMVCGSKEAGALAHLYRAEVFRSTVWRQRLDQSTNWAIVSTGIALSIVFASAQASVFPILLVKLLCVLFLLIEARRYRFFYVWRFRARLLEITFFVPLLQGQGAGLTNQYGTPLSDDYKRPQYRITMQRAIGRRLRRVYAYVFATLGFAFFAKLLIHPVDVPTIGEFVYRAHFGPIPGWIVLVFILVFHLTWIVFAWITWNQDANDSTKMEDYLESSRDFALAQTDEPL